MTECSCKISADFDILRQIEVFSGAPAEVIKLFAYLAKHRTYLPGEAIISQGEQSESSFLLISGEVELSTFHKGKDIILQHLNANTFFGELALLARFDWSFTAKASIKSELLVIDRQSFGKIIEKFPERRQQLTERIIQLRVRRFENQTNTMVEQMLAAGSNKGTRVV